MGWAYRKDLFEDPAEMEAFKAKYGYDLAVPTTWAQLHDIAEFFTRPDNPKNGVKYGVGVYTQKDYDGMIMGYQNPMFSYGAYWFGEGYAVEGVVNSPEAVEALKFYHELYQVCASRNQQCFLCRDERCLHLRSGGDDHELLRLLPGAGQSRRQSDSQTRPASSPVLPARMATALFPSAVRV